MIINCLVVACIFGVCPLIEKHILKFIHIESFIILSAMCLFVLAMVYTFFIHNVKLMEDIQYLNKNSYLYVLILLFVLLFYIAAHYIYLFTLQKHKLSHVTMVVATFPFITAILAFLFFEESINLIQFIGFCVAVIAMVLLENELKT